jgi:hypothetical protein
LLEQTGVAGTPYIWQLEALISLVVSERSRWQITSEQFRA